MLLTDYQTIAFYQVDPKTLVITPVPDPNNNNQPLTVKLPNLNMTSNQVALAAGRLRQCGGNGSPAKRTASLMPISSSSGRSTSTTADRLISDIASSLSRSHRITTAMGPQAGPSPPRWCRRREAMHPSAHHFSASMTNTVPSARWRRQPRLPPGRN
jgi:hypothetical protein